MSTTMTTEQAFNKVREQAEIIKNDMPIRFSEAASPGDGHRQGDVCVWLLDALPVGCKIQKHVELQIAPGNTQGSRHCLDSVDGVKLYLREQPDFFQGPILRMIVERTITHPEHGDVILPPGLYEITYQRTLDREMRARRVED